MELDWRKSEGANSDQKAIWSADLAEKQILSSPHVQPGELHQSAGSLWRSIRTTFQDTFQGSIPVDVTPLTCRRLLLQIGIVQVPDLGDLRFSAPSDWFQHWRIHKRCDDSTCRRCRSTDGQVECCTMQHYDLQIKLPWVFNYESYHEYLSVKLRQDLWIDETHEFLRNM